MDSQVPGINKWAAGIRFRMANDPGRQDLDDHILCNGFLFLEEYLEDILTGARTEPIIELTKTPGRRKDTTKKVRAATTATMKIVPLELELLDKENIPVSKPPAPKKAPTPFQKALLKASKENQPPNSEDGAMSSHISSRSEPRSPFVLAVQSRDENVHEEEAVETLITPPMTRVVSGSRLEETPQLILPPTFSKRSTDLADVAESGVTSTLQNGQPSPELSIIAEGDEAEMSRASLPSRPNVPIIREKVILYPIPKDPSDPNGPMATATVSYDPTADDDDDIQAFQTPYDRSFNDSEPTSTASSFPIDPYARDYETHELRYLMAEQASEHAAFPQSPPTQTLVRKASVPVFPSLPGPSPFRKSTHEPSGSGPSNNARQSAVAGNGTRTSWLNKARDVTAKRTSVVSGVKRKSVELGGEPSSMTLDDDHTRATKVAKTSAEVDISTDNPEKLQGKISIQPFRPVVTTKSRELPVAPPAVTPDNNSEGMMNILKRTVEGLGARVGKSMGKSLGGAAATAAAAEAKAAAEARLAQREAKGSDENRQGRLSVSDLIGVYDNGKGKGKVPNVATLVSPAPDAIPEPRASISTTPPDSPPAMCKPNPLASLNLVAATSTIPKFTIQRNVTLEPSFTLPDSQPSTQSTYMSSIFDDHSAWPPSSQTTDFTASQGFSQPEASVKESSFTQNYEASALSQEVGWIHGHQDHAAVYRQTTNLSHKHEELVVRDQVVVQDESHSRFPGAFEPEDEYMGLAESEEETTEATGRYPTSPPSDAGLTKSKDSSSEPSSQTGFVAQASGLFSKVLGTSVGNALGASKRGKAEPVKSIQLAAMAAKKQQEEADRKAARLREMDKRRAAIASKKAEQDAAEKVKQQGERRKREREEGQEKKVTRATVKKEEEVVKKRKVVVEIEKKPESKKPTSKDKKDLGGSRIGKPVPNSSSQLGLSKSFKQPGLPASASQSTVKLVGTGQGDVMSTTKLPSMKDKKGPNVSEDARQPSQTLQAQMQARVEVQLFQARQDEPLIPSESIELPDINSEYSNSDDEDRPRTFDPPGWAQSPDLRLALESQSRMNPDDIFGPVRPLRMEEIFPTRQSRFRARTSSANWAGTDEVTRDEETRYAKRMGYLD